jgi:hypothetical protein
MEDHIPTISDGELGSKKDNGYKWKQIIIHSHLVCEDESNLNLNFKIVSETLEDKLTSGIFILQIFLKEEASS